VEMALTGMDSNQDIAGGRMPVAVASL